MRRGARHEARQAGLTHYFTGQPCKCGHVAQRFVCNARCVECHDITCRARREANPEEHRAIVRRARIRNPERALAQDRKKRSNNREKRNAYSRAYNKKNRKRLNAYNIEWMNSSSPRALVHKIGLRLRGRLLLAIKNKQRSGSAVRDLGCSVDELISFISAKFTMGMTWDNWGEHWQLDHIKPLKEFDLTNRAEFLRACHYSNLQPLLIAAHRAKTAAENSIRR